MLRSEDTPAERPSSDPYRDIVARTKDMRKMVLFTLIPLLLLAVGVAGCGDSPPSLVGKWQDISGSLTLGQTIFGNTIATYGQVIDVIDSSNISLANNNAVTYSLIDSSHLKLTTSLGPVILDMKLDSDQLTLTVNGQSTTFARADGNTLPLAAKPSPVGGTWRSSNGASLTIADENGGTTDMHAGDTVRFDGNTMGGTVRDGSAVGTYTVDGPNQIVMGWDSSGFDYTVVSKTRNSLVLGDSGGGYTYSFTRANRKNT